MKIVIILLKFWVKSEKNIWDIFFGVLNRYIVEIVENFWYSFKKICNNFREILSKIWKKYFREIFFFENLEQYILRKW